MCCNGISLSAHSDEIVNVRETSVATPLPDGIWLNTFPQSKDAKFPDLIGYGPGSTDKPSTIKLFLNPKNARLDATGWGVVEIQRLDFPVGMAFADLTGNGLNDIIICDRFGPSMSELWDARTNNGGRVQWLRNPGNTNVSTPYWEVHQIGNSTGMHRVQVGHFTTRDHFQVIGIPIISASNNFTSPAPVIIYTPSYGPDISKGPQSWSEDIPFPSQFRLVHEIKVLTDTNNGLDMVLVAGREGIVLLWFDESQRAWRSNVVGPGSVQDRTYWGSGSVDVARVRDDDVGYIPACEAYHGNTVSVYIKEANAPKGAASLKDRTNWKRIVVDDFGQLDPQQRTGTIHHVASVKIDNSDVDSFVIACVGAPLGKPENQGVFMYTPIDLSRGLFKRTKLSGESAGRIAIGNFVDPRRPDVASISYYAPGYHTGPDPPSIRINTLEPCHIPSRTSITVKKLDKEVLIQIPRPNAVPSGEIPTLSIFNLTGKKFTLVVLPPGARMTLGVKDAAKVVFGEIHMINERGVTICRTIAPPALQVDTTMVLSLDGVITAGKDGAVFLRVEILDSLDQGPYKTMSSVTITNQFPRIPEVDAQVRAMEFPFLKVETLPFATSGPKAGLFDGLEFYNMAGGFYVYFNDDSMDQVVHIQNWALGFGETARFHNHQDRSFCELHYCLANSGGQSGMRYFEDSFTAPVDSAAELTKEYVERNSKLLVVPYMYEQGPMWKIQPGSVVRPQLYPNDTADYPWHGWIGSSFGDYRLPMNPPLPIEQQKYDVWMVLMFPTTAFQF